MTKKLWTYFLGATIVDQEVVRRVQEYENIVHELFKKSFKDKYERHITIVPPFLTNYETASEINMKCMAATLLSSHPLTTTRFLIQGLEIMSFDGLEVLYFPVTMDREKPVAEMLFIDYVKALRAKFCAFGIQFKNKIPNEYRPHITVFVGEKIKESKEIHSLLNKSRDLKPLVFHSGYPTLYAKCENGWGDLLCDPNSD